MRARTSIAAVAALALTLGLGGCISVFPKAPPSNFYRFAVPGGAPAATSSSVVVLKGPVEFNQAAAGDHILTSEGDSLSYIGGARWISPANVLFDDAVDKAFASTEGAPRLIHSGQMGHSDLTLRMAVPVFEARYENGEKAAPTVVVEIRASLLRSSDRSVVGEKTFTSSKTAADNRVGAIVQAYDQAVTEALAGVVSWSGSTGG